MSVTTDFPEEKVKTFVMGIYGLPWTVISAASRFISCYYWLVLFDENRYEALNCFAVDLS